MVDKERIVEHTGLWTHQWGKVVHFNVKFVAQKQVAYVDEGKICAIDIEKCYFTEEEAYEGLAADCAAIALKNFHSSEEFRAQAQMIKKKKELEAKK